MLRQLQHRLLLTNQTTTNTITRLSSSFTRPSPPRLPKALQAEFENLQRKAAVSDAFQPPSSSDPSSSSSSAKASSSQDSSESLDHSGGLFRGAKPEFEGDTNPKTGEVGGPKNEPLRWGGDGDWSYNGRVTDF